MSRPGWRRDRTQRCGEFAGAHSVEIAKGWQLFVGRSWTAISRRCWRSARMTTISTNCSSRRSIRERVSARPCSPSRRQHLPNEILLRTAVANAKAIAWYEREGFVRENEVMQEGWSGPRCITVGGLPSVEPDRHSRPNSRMSFPRRRQSTPGYPPRHWMPRLRGHDGFSYARIDYTLRHIIAIFVRRDRRRSTISFEVKNASSSSARRTSSSSGMALDVGVELRRVEGAAELVALQLCHVQPGWVAKPPHRLVQRGGECSSRGTRRS